MCDLRGTGIDPCLKNPPGTKTKLYVTRSFELNGYPATRAELGGTDPGDTKILDEPFDFSLAAAGTGYWREFDILVDTGEVQDVLEGEKGGQGYKSSINFTIPGTTAQRLETADQLAQISGYNISMIRDRSGNLRVLGELDSPAYLESAEGTTGKKNGDQNGFVYKLSASTGQTAPIYDDATHGIDITPNP